MDIGDKLAKVGADLVSLSEKIDTTSAAGKMVFRLLAVMNEFERDQISERTKSALQYKKAQGGCVGTVAFGYELAADGSTLIENADEQKIIAAVRDYRDAGLALRTIVTRLDEQGYRSRSGKPFQLTQVARIANG